MVQLKHSEKRAVDDAFGMGGGYVLNFSDRTFAEWFDDEFGIQIYGGAYSFNGSSKAKHLRAFMEVEDGHKVGAVLRALWRYSEQNDTSPATPEIDARRRRLFEIIARIESAEGLPSMDAIERFKRDETLDELIAAIQRDISANKPAAALDRLHLYCMKKFAHLLNERGIGWNREEPLHSRVGKYVKALEQERDLRKVTLRILKSSIGVFDDLNDVRNNKSFAHDNDLVDRAEARFIFDSVSNILRFVKAVDTARFGT